MLLPTLLFAQGGQFTGSGYYRVQNKASQRYVSVVDNKNTTISATNNDLCALLMLSDFEEEVASNPATICYFEETPNGYNLKGQDLNLKDLSGYYLQIESRANGSYRLYGKVSAVVMYLIDYTIAGWRHPNTGGGDYAFWYMLPVTQGDGQYFGVKPDVQATADGTYWATLYAGFAYKPSDTGMKVYRVDRTEGAYAIIREITDVVPANTPVLVRCNGAAPKDNKLTLVAPQSVNVGTNVLKGNFYCNDEEGQPQHRNVTAYDPNTMRVLGTTADGYPAFVKSSTLKYLPANTSYLTVSSSAPDVISIITWDEYSAGVSTVEADVPADGAVYDLHGRRVASPDRKGVYIRNGRKFVVR